MTTYLRRAVVGAALGIAMAAPVGAVTYTTVMSGLNSPRGIAFSPNGALYVAEAGMAGDNTLVVGDRTIHYGLTGSISRYWRGQQTRVVNNLPSANAGEGITGPSDVGFRGNGNGFATIGFGSDPAIRPLLGPEFQTLGTVIRFTPNGAWDPIADIAAYELTHNAGDNNPLESNPYGLAVGPRGVFVADAGANDVLLATTGGSVTRVAHLPNRMVEFPPGSQFPMQAVPTSVTLGPDGALYVGQLTGFPFPVGGANVYRVTPGSAPTVYASGLTGIIDLQFGPRGDLYVLQYGGGPFTPIGGSLVKIARNGAKTTVLSGLGDVTSFTFDSRGTLYLSTGAFAISTGPVVRVTF